MDSMAPTVTAVVLTTGDRAEELSTAINSLRRAGIQEVLLVWNSTAPQPPSTPGVEIVSAGKNLGITAGRNFGASHGDGDIIVFLDDDAELLTEGALGRISAHFEENPVCAVVAFRIVDEIGTTLRRHNPRLGTRGAAKPGPVGTFLGGACAVRRSNFTDCGGFDPNFGYSMEEQDLTWRLHKVGLSVHYRPDILVRHPHTDPSRHAQALQRTWRNRVTAARRSLPLPIRLCHLTLHGARALLHGLQPNDLIAGMAHDQDLRVGAGSPLTARQIWTLTRLGRPPIF